MGLAKAMAWLELEGGRTLDPQLLGLFQTAARETYVHLDWREDIKELELQPIDLRYGMRLARDVISGTGLLLLGRGEELDEARIAAIKRYYRIDPPKHGVYVMVASRWSLLRGGETKQLKRGGGSMNDAILLVDDEPNVLAALTRSLIDEPYQVLSASSGDKALEMIAATPVKVIVSDERMSGMAGSELLAEVRRRFPRSSVSC